MIDIALLWVSVFVCCLCCGMSVREGVSVPAYTHELQLGAHELQLFVLNLRSIEVHNFMETLQLITNSYCNFCLSMCIDRKENQ